MLVPPERPRVARGVLPFHCAARRRLAINNKESIIRGSIVLRVIVRCLLISLLVAVPTAAAVAAGLVGFESIAASGGASAAVLTGAVVAVSAFVSALLASWWNGGVVTVADAETAFAAESGQDEGVVKWFNVAKGFGFITLDAGGDIFVHFRDIRGKGHRSLTAGQRVAFTIKETDKGPQAHDVTAIAEA